MSMSDIESLAQDTKDLEENNEKAPKENNENMDNNELNENMDSIDFLTSHEKDHKENNDVEDSEEEEEKEEKKKKMVIVMDPPKEGTTTSSDSGVVSNFLRSKKEMKWCMVLLGLRIAAVLFCLISFSVLAANEQKVLVKKSIIDWYLTHEYSLDTTYSFNWHDYDEFKYSFTANILGFVYSVLQICDLLRYSITKKHTVDPKLRGYFNIAMDQALAYIIMSASSSAAATVHLYKGYWVEHGGHKFTEMANASVAMSFFAFGAFALASPVSGFILTRFS